MKAIVKFGGDEENTKYIKLSRDFIYTCLDNLANQILARCIIVTNRLTHGEDKESEENIMSIAFDWQRCYEIPKPKETDKEKLQETVNKVLNGDKELLQRIADLPYVANWVKEKLEEE